MTVIGARFPNLEKAVAALRAVRARVSVAPDDVAVRPLGSTRYEEPARGFVLAGQFAAGDADVVTEILRRQGGAVFREPADEVST